MVMAKDFTWSGAEESQNLSDNRDSYHSAIAVTDNEVAVAWAGESKTLGIFLARLNRITNSWMFDTVRTSSNRNARFPDLLYANGTLNIVWAEVNENYQVLFQKVDDNAPTIVMDELTFSPIPRIAAGTNNVIHLVFASRVTQERSELYYTYQKPGDNWATPEVIVTQAQVIDGEYGGIWSPSIAVSPNGQNIYVAWEQVNTTGSNRTIWHIQGTWSDSGTNWTSPEQVSQSIPTIKPDIVVDSTGQVHITWARVVGPLTNPTEQYIEYMALGGVIRQVDAYPVKVNNFRPTLTSPRIAAYQSTICVAWHGYRQEALMKFEDVLLRCSSDAGQSWTVTVNATESGQNEQLSLFPALALDGAGIVHLAWEEFQGGDSYRTNYDILYRAGSAEIKVNTLYLPLIMRGR